MWFNKVLRGERKFIDKLAQIVKIIELPEVIIFATIDVITKELTAPGNHSAMQSLVDGIVILLERCSGSFLDEEVVLPAEQSPERLKRGRRRLAVFAFHFGRPVPVLLESPEVVVVEQLLHHDRAVVNSKISNAGSVGFVFALQGQAIQVNGRH